MPLVVSEDIRDEDYDSLFVIQYKAFSSDSALRALYPGGLDSASRASNISGFIAGLGWKESNVTAAKVVDTNNGEICAFATMRVYDENPFLNAAEGAIRFPHVDNSMRDAVEWTFNTKDDRRTKFEALQAPGRYCYLQALGTDPARQREGAASLLVDWAIQIADKTRSRMMVEASEVAVKYGLYTRRGFRVIDEYHYIDEKRFPGYQGAYLITMVRDSQE